MLFADFVLHPAGVSAWVVAGLIAGWLAGKVAESPSYGIIGDLLLGGIGALVCGALVGFFVQGEPALWVSLLVAFLSACVLIVVVRVLVALRSA